MQSAEDWTAGYFMTFTIPKSKMLDKHRYLDLDGYNKEDAWWVILAWPAGDLLH